MGPKWHEIAKLVHRRTEIQVKNRFNCILKKSGDLNLDKAAHVALCLKKARWRQKQMNVAYDEDD
jgi:hypothetical protein